MHGYKEALDGVLVGLAFFGWATWSSAIVVKIGFSFFFGGCFRLNVPAQFFLCNVRQTIASPCGCGVDSLAMKASR